MTVPDGGSALRRDPAAVWLAAEAMRGVAARLLFLSVVSRHGKSPPLDDANGVPGDMAMARRDGYVVASTARQLGFDPGALIRILRDDHVWEHPAAPGYGAIFRAAADVAERVSVEARLRCADAGIDPEQSLRGDCVCDVAAPAATPAVVQQREAPGGPSAAPVPRTPAPDATGHPPPAGLKPCQMRAWSQVTEALRRDPDLRSATPSALYAAARAAALSAGDPIAKQGSFLRYYRQAKRYFAAGPRTGADRSA